MATDFTWTGDVQRGGAWLRRLREGRGWTQRDVDKRTNGKVSAPNISQIEIGAVTKPAMAMLVQLGAALDVTPNEIAEAYGWWTPPALGEGEEREPEQLRTLKATLSRLSPGERYKLLAQIEVVARMAERESAGVVRDPTGEVVEE